MDVMQFAGHVSNGADTGERPSVVGPDRNGARLWLANGWGVMVSPGTDSAHFNATAVRFAEPYAAGWETEPVWLPAVAPIDTGRRPGLPSHWQNVTPADVAGVLGKMAALAPVQPQATAEGPLNNFACPLCGELAVRDLSTLDYRADRQSAECESCGKPIHRYPDNLGAARAWRIGA